MIDATCLWSRMSPRKAIRKGRDLPTSAGVTKSSEAAAGSLGPREVPDNSL
ncbi:hypothetical protein [Rhizobium lentis]|uniref:Uncharacterized protein n=1 Tax=Rhizobium lentis TaxID=1138194 RepID=A0A7W8XIH0_9HYPH|nr:hypothetical protein [Rhizobium lentis]MBB4576665.1 hypothetical protein [Rhizobium lentis]MBB5552968.1 hypothetical protein [Rhizobium lentis]MBB5563513.1 hypothetical protein [Rhizobium lentis]MBB5570051.1 hypothetical protein [Rhizobium lentis]